MISKIDVRMCGGELTKDERDDEGLDVLCAGFVGVPRKVGDVQAQGSVVAQDSVEICKRDSGQRGARDDAGTEYHLLAKKAQARVEPLKVVPLVMTVLVLMVPPALRNVSPKMAKKMIGAITLLKAKKYWTLVELVGLMNPGELPAGPYLGVRYA
jgi:hypothetical protein